MQAIANVEREVDKVISHFSALNDHVQKTLNDLIVQLQSLHQDFVSLTDNENGEMSSIQRMIMEQNMKKIREILTQISSEHKDLHSSVSKIGKQIDKNFYSEFQCISNEQQFFINLNETNRFTKELRDDQDDGDEHMDVDTQRQAPIRKKSRDGKLSALKQLDLINKVILQHLLRVSSSEVAANLVREANLNVGDTSKWPFNDLNAIVEALRRKDLEPALRWAKEHEKRLNDRNSLLLFKLHKLKFVQMLQDTDAAMSRLEVHDANAKQLQAQLIQYARTHLQQFSIRHSKEIQQLMCCLMYLPSGLTSSPYGHLFADAGVDKVVELFTREACSLLGLSIESPLTVTFNAGCVALPALLNIRQVMRQRQVSGVWSCKDELPIVLDLGKEAQFHSVFACPILREQGKESNPPMRLICGHVISRDALNKLTNGTKLKCPYCPVEQNPIEARQIYF